LADIKKESAEKMNAELGLKAKIYTDYEEMLEIEKPDVISANLWAPLHLKVIRDSAESGVKVLMSEKPMAPAWGECLEIKKIAEKPGFQLSFSHQRRYAKGNILARKYISEGKFGKIHRMDLYSPMNLLDCGTHTLDQAMSFINETPVKTVLGGFDAKPQNWFGVSFETSFTGYIVFENGVSASIQCGCPDPDMFTGVRIIGDKGFLEVEWDGYWKNCSLSEKPVIMQPKTEEEKISEPRKHLISMVKDVLDCYESGKEPETSWKKAMRASEAIFALYEASVKRTRIDLPVSITGNPFIDLIEGNK
jgi:predicted dehydrogenase